MTNETNRTKTKVSGIGKRGIAIVLCFVMLLTAIGSGSVLSAIAVEGNGASVLLDAAKAGASVDVAADVAAADDKSAADEDEAPLTKKADSDLADTGRDADIAASGYTANSNAKIYFDTSNWSSFNTSHTVYCAFIFGDQSAQREILKMNSISNSRVYYLGNSNGYSGTWSDGLKGVMFFSSSSTGWNKGYENNKGYDDIVAWCGGYYTGVKGTNIYDNHAYYFSAASNTSGTAPNLDKDYDNVNTTINTSTAESDGLWRYAQVANVYYRTSSSGSYAYAGDNNNTKGGTVSVQGRYWNGWNSVSSAGYGKHSGSSATAYGDYVSYDAAARGTSVTVTASAYSGYTFNGWYWDTAGTNLASTNTSFTYSPVTSNTTIYAMFTLSTKTYYLTGYLNGTDVTTRIEANKFTGSSTSVTLNFNSTVDTFYPTVYDNGDVAYHPSSHKASSGATSTGSTTNGPGKDNKWMVTGAKNKTVTFTFNTSTGALSWTVAAGEMITVYAKDGAAPIDWDHKTQGGATTTSGYNGNYYYNFAAIATTSASSSGVTFSSVDCGITGVTNSGSKYQTGAVEAGKNITITTTISSTYKSTYYVRGWNINGYTYTVGTNVKGVNTTANTSTGAYTMTYTIPATLTSSTKIEITPIYYLVNNANTITFYLEGFDEALQTTGGWGNTPYCYPFYGSLSGYQNSFGAYPGQPMVFVDGKYSIEIPITSKAISSATYDGTIIKGVTVNNGYADHVHRNLVYGWTTASGDTANDNKHMQTYDYDDFYKIYNEKRDSQGNKPNSIILRIKNETTYYNRDNYGDAKNGINWKFTKEDPNATLSNTEVSTIAGSTRNGWELLTDRYGRPVDLFGNVISTSYSATAEQSKPAIRVISTGYNENIAGDYGTAWLIYTPTGSTGYTTAVTNGGYTGSSGYTLQTAASNRKAVPPSVFLLSSESSFNTSTYPAVSRTFDGASYTDTITNYKTLYNTLKTSGSAGTNALGRYVYITYEKNAQRYGANASSSATRTLYGAYRADARWFYTYATDMVNSKVKIQYWNGSKYVDEASYVTGYNNIKNQGSNTGCRAYFTNTSFDGAVESGDVLINSGDFNFTAKSASGWMFDSWQIEYDGGNTYTELSTDASASTSMSASDTYVARFKPIDAGNLNISHNLSADSTGAGTTELKVVVYTNDTKTSPIYDTGYTTDDVALDGEFISDQYTNYYIEVSLKTTPSGDDVFNNMTGPADKFFGGVTTKTGTNPYTFGFKVADLYNTGATSQTTKSLAYYSKITKTDHTYKITYNYPKRGSSTNDGSYTVSGTFTSNEYAAYVDTATTNRPVADAFIKSKAPYESNFNKTLSLNYSSKSCTYNTSTHAHNVTINYTSADDVDTYVIFDLPYDYYTAAGTDSGVAYKKYTAKPNASGKIVTTDDAETIEIDTVYGNFLTSADGCAQTKVGKVADDSGDPNHTGNDFITAPEEMYSADGNTKLYFNYWQIMTADRSLELNRVYYVDFNYRSYGNYYVKPVYTANANDCWRLKTQFENDFSASIMYLDTTRNQWNSSSSTNTTSSATAADLIYNDFLIAYGFKGEEIKGNSKVTDIGVIFELVPTAKGGTTYAKGDASSASTAVYKTQYDSTIPDDSTLKGIVNSGSSGNYIKAQLDKDKSNEKNRMEYAHSFYAQYGQNGFDFKSNPATDDYVFRAYAYIKDSSNNIAISDPVYFCMRYTANRKG